MKRNAAAGAAVLNKKMDALKKAIEKKGALAVGFSGGVDSALLAKVAYDALGENALAVTIDSELLPRSEFRAARELARLIGIRHSVVKSSPLSNKRFADNPKNRCYYCKKDDVSAIAAEAGRNGCFTAVRGAASPLLRRGIKCVAFGATASDLSDYRPGIKACDELGVWQPLLELGFTKDEVRAAAKLMRLPVWNKPAAACLASRIACGEAITKKKLAMIERAEDFLHSLGFDLVRVRLHDDSARIEVAPDDIAKAAALAGKIAPALRALGYERIVLDMEGYTPGGANLQRKKK